jgi:hypothetical protein
MTTLSLEDLYARRDLWWNAHNLCHELTEQYSQGNPMAIEIEEYMWQREYDLHPEWYR